MNKNSETEESANLESFLEKHTASPTNHPGIYNAFKALKEEMSPGSAPDSMLTQSQLLISYQEEPLLFPQGTVCLIVTTPYVILTLPNQYNDMGVLKPLIAHELQHFIIADIEKTKEVRVSEECEADHAAAYYAGTKEHYHKALLQYEAFKESGASDSLVITHPRHLHRLNLARTDDILNLSPSEVYNRFNNDCSLKGTHGVSEVISQYTPPTIDSDLPGAHSNRHNVTNGMHFPENLLGEVGSPIVTNERQDNSRQKS